MTNPFAWRCVDDGRSLITVAHHHEGDEYIYERGHQRMKSGMTFAEVHKDITERMARRLATTTANIDALMRTV